MRIRKLLPSRQIVSKLASALALCSVIIGALPAEAQRREKPNLKITREKLTKSRVELGQQAIVSFRIVNVGKGNVENGLTVSYYLSKDQQLSGDDQRLDVSSQTALASGNDAVYDRIPLDIPTSMATGGYYFLVNVAVDDVEDTETTTSDNLVAMPITLLEATDQPDLVVRGVKLARSRRTSGETLNVTYRVFNIGSADAEASFVEIGLYSNGVLRQSAPVGIGSIEANSSESYLTGITIDDNLSSGVYTVKVVADNNGAVAESNERNNESDEVSLTVQQTAEPVDPQPNLILSSYTANNETENVTVKQGESVTLRANTTNVGGGRISSTRTVYRLMKGDEVIIDRNSSINSMSAGQSRTSSVIFNIPGDIEPGLYSLVTKADGYNWRSESNEDDNEEVITLLVRKNRALPNLTARKIEVNTRVIGLGDRVELSTKIFNIGNGDARNNRVRFYLSKDEVFSNDDTYLSQRSLGAINSLGSREANSNFTFSREVSPGAYNILAVMDFFSEVGESNELDNVISTPVTIKPLKPTDLVMSEISTSFSNNTILNGQRNTITLSVANNGAGGARFSYVRLYLSDDNVLDDNDQVLTDRYVDVIAAGGTRSTSASITIPRGPGTYYLFAEADIYNSVNETNETNNISRPVEITVTQPDLLIENASPSQDSVVTGTQITVSYDITNSASISVNSSTGFYLSTDSTYDASDSYITRDYVGGLDGETRSLSHSVNINAPSDTGTYYVLLVADELLQVNELNEDNNVYAMEIYVGYPDWVVESLTSNKTTINSGGDDVTLTYEVGNQGAVSSTDFIANDFFISDDNVFDIADQLLVRRNTTLSLDPGNSAIYLYQITINKTPGTYYLFARADNSNISAEEDEGNNVSDPIEITVIDPNQVARRGSLEKEGAEDLLGNDNQTFSTLKVYPNPTDGIFFLQHGDELKDSQVTITDIYGKIVYQGELSQTQQSIDLAEQAAGIYMLSIRNSEQVKTQQIIKR